MRHGVSGALKDLPPPFLSLPFPMLSWGGPSAVVAVDNWHLSRRMGAVKWMHDGHFAITGLLIKRMPLILLPLTPWRVVNNRLCRPLEVLLKLQAKPQTEMSNRGPVAVHYPRSTTPVPKCHAKIAQEERAGSVGLISPLSDYHIFLTAFRGTPPQQIIAVRQLLCCLCSPCSDRCYCLK